MASSEKIRARAKKKKKTPEAENVAHQKLYLVACYAGRNQSRGGCCAKRPF